VTADCRENQSSSHDVCDENRERRLAARVQALFEAVDGSSPEGVGLCDVQNLINSLKLKRRPVELMVLQKNALGTIQGHWFT